MLWGPLLHNCCFGQAYRGELLARPLGFSFDPSDAHNLALNTNPLTSPVTTLDNENAGSMGKGEGAATHWLGIKNILQSKRVAFPDPVTYLGSEALLHFLPRQTLATDKRPHMPIQRQAHVRHNSKKIA